jgi:hypothetical protein
MIDGRDKKYTHDEWGETWLVDSTGAYLKVDGKKVPGPAARDGFGYDTSRGHCYFCGKIICGGRCFR